MNNQIFEKIFGFTLLEVLFVLFILSLLFLLIFPRLTNVLNRSYDINIRKTANTFRNLMSMYYQDHNKYPKDSYNFIQLKEDILSQYGQLGNIGNALKSHSYSANNSSDPKYFELKLTSSKTNVIYIITPNDVKTTE